MPLEQLSRKIHDTTRSLLAGSQQQLARTFYLVVSPGLEVLPEWYAEWFPEEEELLARQHPWLLLPPDPAGGQELLDRLSEACRSAFDIRTVNELISKGYQLREHHNQLILIADATDPEVLRRLEEVREAFRQVTNNLPGRMEPFFISVILLLKKMVGEGQHVEIRQVQDEKRLLEGLGEKVDRVFLVDLNNAGFIIKEENDLLFLLGQLIHFLTQAALQDAVGQFGEWMRSGNAGGRQGTGFSAATLSLPVEQILENLLVTRGADMLEARLLGEYDEKQLANLLLIWKNRTYTNSLESLTGQLLTECSSQLLTPFGKDPATLPEIWSIANSARIIQEIDLADAGMAGHMGSNEKILAVSCETRELDYAYELSAFLEAMIATSKGGMSLAETFLLSLREQTRQMIPEEIEELHYDDVAPFLEKLRRQVDKGPRLAPLLMRAALFILPPLVAAVRDFHWLYIAILLSGLLAPLLYWHAFNTVVDRQVVRLRQAFTNKWQTWQHNIALHKAADLLQRHLAAIDEHQDRVSKARQRSETLIAAFRERAAQPVPDASAFWHYIMHTPEEYAGRFAQLAADAPDIQAQFMKQVKLENLIDRLALEATEPLTQTELQLLEQAALLFLPSAVHLVDKNLMELLLSEPARYETYFAMLQRTASPFLQLLPGETAVDLTGFWEVPANLPEELHRRLTRATDGITSSRVLLNGNPFRIAFYTLIEGIPMHVVRWRA